MTLGGIVAVGDSITNACSKDLVVGGVPPRSWVEWVAVASGLPLKVHARPGASSSAIRELLPEVSTAYELGLVYVGVNNIISWRWWRRDDLEVDLRDIVKRISNCSERVGVMQYPNTLGKAATLFPYGPFLRRRLRTAQDTVVRVTAETGSILIVPPPLTGSRIWVDGVHPTSAGHLALGHAALAVLGLPGLDAVDYVPSRENYDRWRRKEKAKFSLRQPIHGIGTWLLGR